MQTLVLLNGDSGTLAGTDIASFRHHVEFVFAGAGHSVDCRIVRKKNLMESLRKASEDPAVECLVVAGGDGTVSIAGHLAWKSGKVLGVIPAGTMNLFSRSLGVPLEIWQAAEMLASARPARCDIATADGRAFLHQYSVGFHPRMVRLRNRYRHHSKFGKIWASFVSALTAIQRPPVFRVVVECNQRRSEREITALSISNNPFGEGHIPYADRLDTGKLCVYLTGPLSAGASALALVDVTLGSWRENPDIESFTAERISLRFPNRRKFAKAIVDGELVPLEDKVDFAIHKGELKVLMPSRPQ